MGSMRDQMLKAGLANQKQARKVRHDDQARKKEMGEAAVQGEKRSRDEEFKRSQKEQRQQDRQREIERSQQQDESLHTERVPALIRSGQVKGSSFGNKRFHFVTDEQTVSFVEVAPVVARGLADGRHAIVDARGVLRDDFCVIEADAARSIQAIEPERVLFLQGNGA